MSSLVGITTKIVIPIALAVAGYLVGGYRERKRFRRELYLERYRNEQTKLDRLRREISSFDPVHPKDSLLREPFCIELKGRLSSEALGELERLANTPGEERVAERQRELLLSEIQRIERDSLSQTLREARPRRRRRPRREPKRG